MNHVTAGVSGAPGMDDGQVSATLADAWFDPERSDRIVRLAARIERLRAKTTDRLATAHTVLEEGLQGHPLESRLRAQLLVPLEHECAELVRVFKRVHTRLALFAPAASQAQFEEGLALQLEDLRSARAASPEQAPPTVPTLPLGYWMSEESFNRLQRACSTALLLGSLGDGVGERLALSFDAMAASADYVREDLAAVLADATHSSKLGDEDE